MKKPTFPYYPHLLFIVLLAIISFVYGYQDMLVKKPQSVHKWRQADGASIALNYYQGGMNFFKPEVHNLTSDSGTSGKCCPSEAPVLYYTVACLYKIFGYHDWIYRGLNTLIFFCGLFFLFRLFLYLIKDVFWAIALPLLFFTSPLLVYYANNYPINTTALALSIIAWYYFSRFLFERKTKWFYICVLFFFLAAALKVTALFSPVAIGFIYLLELFKLRKFGSEGKLFLSFKKCMLPLGLIFLLVAAWLKYAHDYNVAHDCTYFSTTVFPIWDLDKTEIGHVIDNVKNIWLPDYFHVSVLVFLLLAFVYCGINYKKLPALFGICFAVILILAVVYVLLQFRQFADHDYYVIDLYLLPVLVLAGAFFVLKQQYGKFFSSPALKIVFAVFVCLNVFYAKGKVNERYTGPVNDYAANKDFYWVSTYLRQIGIPPGDTVISVPDMTNVSLYLMNVRGWTEYTDARLNRGNPVPYNADEAGIKSSVSKGAKYLIVNGIEELYKKPYLQKFATRLIGKYNKILVFNLKSGAANFSAGQRKILKNFSCDAESISADKEFFMGADSTKFSFGKSRNDSCAHGGKYACRLDKNIPYGMTVKIPDVKYGESFVITVWRKKQAQTKSTIIASADSTYYNNEFIVTETAGQWEKLSKEFFIPENLAGKEITIYLYNEDSLPAWFDDLEIICYDSFENIFKKTP